jgi:hypothetical protein
VDCAPDGSVRIVSVVITVTCRPEITMEHSARVCETNCFAGAKKGAQSIRSRGKRLDVFTERLAVDKFHRVKDTTIGQRADIVHRNDSGVFQQREHARLAHQAICQLAF